MFSFLHAPLTLSLSPLARSVCVCVCVCVCVFSHVQDHTPKQFQTFSLHMFSHTCLSPLCLSLPVGSDRYADMFLKSPTFYSILFYSILFYSVSMDGNGTFLKPRPLSYRCYICQDSSNKVINVTKPSPFPPFKV